MPRRRARDAVSVREHLEALLGALDRRHSQQIEDMDQRHGQRFDAQQQALAITATALEKRLDGLNELRQMAGDYAARSMPRAEYEASHQGLTTRINDIAEAVTALQARSAGSRVMWGYIIAIISVAAAVVVAIVKR
jgi:hypothetical protein